MTDPRTDLGPDREGAARAARQRDSLPDDVREHPAVQNWHRLGHSDESPTVLEILTLKPKSAVFRLNGVGTGGSNVIAKRTRSDGARVERTIYEEVLPRVPLAGLEYYGFVEDPGSGDDWLFLGDAGDAEFSFRDPGHHVLAAEWLGTFHRYGREVAGADRLPARGPDYYLSHLRTARDNIRENLGNPALTAEDRRVLRSLAGRLDLVEDRWGDVAAFCERVPRTVVHGDFCHKNLVVGDDGDRRFLLPLDWEMAGWGVPAIDLEALDPHLYWNAARRSCPELEVSDAVDLVRYGRLFRQIMGASWGSVELTHEWVRETMYKMEVYEARLGRVPSLRES